MINLDMRVNLTENQKQYKVFKYFLESEYKSNLPIVSESFIDSCCDEKYFLSIKHDAIYASNHHIELAKNKEKYAEFFSKSYNNILEKWVNLVLELNLDNSLEIVNMFTYLLQIGYLSNFTKTIMSDKKITGWEQLEVITNNEDAISISMILKDFLTKLCIDSSVIYYKKNNVLPNKVIEKIIKENSNGEISYRNNIKKTNRTFNSDNAGILISEKDKLYIYDPIDLVCARVNSSNLASVIGENGTFELRPFVSYANINSINEFKILDKLFDSISHEEPYFCHLIEETWDHIYHVVQINKSLINDCYRETLSDIYKINTNMESVKTRVRKK